MLGRFEKSHALLAILLLDDTCFELSMIYKLDQRRNLFFTISFLLIRSQL